MNGVCCRSLAAAWRRVRGRRETVTRVSVVAEIEMHGNVSKFVHKHPRSISLARVSGQTLQLT